MLSFQSPRVVVVAVAAVAAVAVAVVVVVAAAAAVVDEFFVSITLILQQPCEIQNFVAHYSTPHLCGMCLVRTISFLLVFQLQTSFVCWEYFSSSD